MKLSLILFLFLLTQHSFSSQVHLLPLKEVAPNIPFLIEAEVASIDKSERHLKLKNGKEGPAIFIDWKMAIKKIKVLKGNLKANNLNAQFSWEIPIKYDENGIEQMRYSPQSSASGIEGSIKIGQRYLFSFTHIREPESELQYIYRIDELRKKDEIIKLIN